MALAKFVNVDVLTTVQIAANAVVNSAEWDVEDYIEAFIGGYMGRDDTGGALTAGLIARIQANPKTSGDDGWQSLRTYQSALTNPASEAVSGTCNAGQAVVAMADTTGFVAGALVFIKNSTIINSEVHRIKSVATNTSITLDDNLTNAQTGSTCYSVAEKFGEVFSVFPFKRIRIQFDNTANARTSVIDAKGSAGTI